jgi:hypothetical protein
MNPNIAYELVLNPGGHRVFGIGINDINGRLWQFWGSPSNSHIKVVESHTEEIDFRFPTGYDFTLDLRARQVDPALLVAATVRRLAREWVTDRNKDINSGNITT